MKKEELTLSKKIDRAMSIKGYKQLFVVKEMNNILNSEDTISDSLFSRRKKGNGEFSKTQLKALSKILNTEL
jgi:hypothetical protein